MFIHYVLSCTVCKISLLTETDRNFVIPKRKMFYTFKKVGNMKWPPVTRIVGQFFGIYEPAFPLVPAMAADHVYTLCTLLHRM
jgi:hypothetical protein